MQEQALQLPSLVLLLALDLMQGELQGVGGSEPGLQVGELLVRLPHGRGEGEGGRREWGRRSGRSSGA